MGSDANPTQPPPAGQNTTAVDFKLQDPPRALYGWRLHMSMLGLSLALLFSALETTIIATTLTTIGAHFNDYTKVGWVVTAYLVTYSGFLLTYAKLTDILGQRNVLLFALSWFALFSGLCAGSQSMSLTHLIVFRALQGVGGSGIFSVVFVCLVDICPARLLGPYSAMVSSTFALANVLGPIVGGAISDTGDWKWIFLLNVPGSALAAAIIIIALPGGDGHRLNKTTIGRVDVLGSFLSIGSAVMLLYGLQTGGAEHPWSDARIIATIVAGCIAVILFFFYEWILQRRPRAVAEPVLPLRLLKNPRLCFLLLAAFFQGCSFYTTVINLPQLNQIVHLNSATMAGVRILPILLVSSFSSMVSGMIMSKTIRFGWHSIVLGAFFSTLGVGLLIELPFTEGIPARTYGYEIILGFGLGFSMPAFLVIGRVEVDDRDNAVMMGAVNTIRTMGGCIALSACSAILHSELPERLKSLPNDVVSALLGSPTTVLPRLGTDAALVVRHAYNEVYQIEWIAITAMAAAGLLCSIPPFLLPQDESGKPIPETSAAVRGSKTSAEHEPLKVKV